MIDELVGLAAHPPAPGPALLELEDLAASAVIPAVLQGEVDELE
jgi:hypothetical protein